MVGEAAAEPFDLPEGCEGVATVVYEDCAIMHAARCEGPEGLVTTFDLRDGRLGAVTTLWGGVLAEEVRDGFGGVLVRFAMDYRDAVARLEAAQIGAPIRWTFRRYAAGEDGILGDQTFELEGERTLELATGPERVRVFRVDAAMRDFEEVTTAERLYAPDLGLEIGRDLSHTRFGFTSRVLERPVAVHRPGEPGYLESGSALCGATVFAPVGTVAAR